MQGHLIEFIGFVGAARCKSMELAQLLNTCGHLGVAHASACCGTRDEAHAHGNAGAVTRLVVIAGLNGMADAVAKVEQLACACFALVHLKPRCA